MIEVGTIVISKKGRDKGRAFAVFDEVSDNYVLIADGNYHKIQKPKLKNIKHLQMTKLKTDILILPNIKDVQSNNKKLSADIKALLDKEVSHN